MMDYVHYMNIPQGEKNLKSTEPEIETAHEKYNAEK